MIFGNHRTRSRKEFDKEALPHLEPLYAVAIRLTRSERDAEDLVQDTLLRAFRFFHRFERGTNCKAWLFKILHNSFATKYRRRVREREIAGELETAGDAAGTVSQSTVDDARDPERVLVEGMLSDDVRRALDALPEEFRLAVILCDLEELSYREIAEVMECPVGTVMSRLHRGRRLLKETLGGYAADRGIGEGARDTNVIRLRKEEP